jgi:hypothetical protein
MLAESRIFTKNTFFMNHATKHHTQELLEMGNWAKAQIATGKVQLKGPMPRKGVAQIAREKR